MKPSETAVRVTRIMLRGSWSWVVDWKEGDKRRRRYTGSSEDAKNLANEIRAARGGDAEAWWDLTMPERIEVLRVMRQIAEHKTTISEVWKAWLAKPTVPDGTKTLIEMIELLIRAKQTSGRSRRYTHNLELILRSFARGREQMPITAVGHREIEEYLDTRTTAGRKTYRTRISTLLQFAYTRRYIASNPADQVETPMVKTPPPLILTVRQSARAIVWMERRYPRMLGAFSLALFCGLRPEEAQKTSWKAVQLDAAEGARIVVEGQTSKTGQRRIVHPMPAGVAWLRLAHARGAQLPIANIAWRRATRDCAKYLGFDSWPKDVTRHTAASFWVAASENHYQVAEQLGHSPKILKKNYQALVTREDAKRFWGLIPRGKR